jgi:hypothetical protein
VPSISQPSGRGLPLGLTGALAATRYVGATASGAPGSGTFAVGDFIIDQSGKVYVCTVTGSPGTWTQVGGAAAPTARAIYSGGSVSIANDDDGLLTWDSLDAGSALLDIVSDPAAPTVTTAGIYGFTVTATGAGITTGGFYSLRLILDLNGFDAEPAVFSSASVATLSSLRVALASTLYMPAAAIIRVQVHNSDGAATRGFTLNTAVIQRIT